MKKFLLNIMLLTGLAFAVGCSDDLATANFSQYQVEDVSAVSGDETVTLSWTPQDGKPAPQEYYITWTTSSSEGGGSKSVESSATSTVIDGLTNGVIYTFGVQARYAEGLSQKLTTSCQPKTTRIPVSEYKAMAGDKRVYITWVEPVTNLAYTYSLQITADGVNETVSIPSGNTSYLAENLTNGVEYTFTMTCVYPHGLSEAVSAKATPGETSPISVLPTTPHRYELAKLEYNPAYFVQGDVASVLWQFEDGTTSTSTQATYFFPKAGVNTVKITVTYVSGKTETASMDVEVLPFAWATVSGTGYQKASNIVFSNDGQTFYTIGQTTKAIYAVSAITGQISWQYSTASATYGAGPVVAPNGYVIFGTEDSNGTLYALSENGTLRWSVQLGSAVKASPAVTSDGVVYALNNGGTLYAIDLTSGDVKWKASQAGAAGGVAVDKDGTIYMGTASGVWAYTSTGSLKWSCDVAHKVTERGGSLAIGDGILYATLKSKGGVAAINTSTGKTMWTYKSEQNDCYHPVVDASGTVYFCEKNGGLYAVTKNGSLKWRACSTLSFIYNGFSLGDDGCAYISEYVSPFALLKVDSSGNASQLTTSAQTMSPIAIGPDNRIYCGLNGSVAAYDASVGLANSTWPTRGANYQGTNSLK